MGIEISGNSGRPPQGAIESSGSASAAQTSQSAPQGRAANAQGGDQFALSSQASQMNALEAEIAKLPVVDTQRVQDVQQTLATGSFQVEPARVADKILTFEAGLGKA